MGALPSLDGRNGKEIAVASTRVRIRKKRAQRSEARDRLGSDVSRLNGRGRA
jgi:hypothetical protein